MSSQTGFKDGKVDASSISPKHTYYYMNASTFSSALGSTYSGLFLPNGSSTPSYWVASRCVYAYSSFCSFRVRGVYSGNLGASDLFSSDVGSDSSAYRLFPVVSLSSELLSGDNANGFTVSY